MQLPALGQQAKLKVPSNSGEVVEDNRKADQQRGRRQPLVNVPKGRRRHKKKKPYEKKVTGRNKTMSWAKILTFLFGGGDDRVKASLMPIK